MSEQEVLSILEKHYNIINPSLKKMEGYESYNYKVTTLNGIKYVLKIHMNSFEGKDILIAENEILDILNTSNKGFYPKPFPDIEGNLITEIDCKKVYTRLLSFLEGTFLSETTITSKHLAGLGTALAKLDIALKDYKNNAIAARVLKWDLQHCLSRRKYALYIKNAHQKSKVEYFFAQYEENVQPLYYELRKGIIHGDANDWNVLENDGYISGIIDFGDIAYAPIINELAIAIPYAVFGKENPLEEAAILLSAYHKIYPLEEKEIDILYYLVGARMAVSLSHSAFFNKDRPNDEYITISEKPIWDLLYKWLAINPLHAANTFKKACGIQEVQVKDISSLINKRHQYLSTSMSLSYDIPIAMKSAAFQYMYSASCETYLDAYNNIPLVGHSHPKVVAAGQEQMARLNTNTRYIYDILHEYSEKLLSTFPTKLNKVFYVNSGSAASDLAIRMAYNHNQHKNMAVIENGYHGNTMIGINISSYKFDGKGGKGANSNIIKVAMPDDYRGQYTRENVNRGKLYAKDAINVLKQQNEPIAAFIAEPIMGCGGQIPLPPNYLNDMFSYIRGQGGLCIVDEVQIGFSRVGTHFWGFQQHDVIPDIVILGKPMGNGHPMGAVVCTDEVAQSFENGMEFFSSFGGNPVSCAIGKAVLEAIEEEGLQEKSLDIGNYIMDELKTIQSEFDIIGDVRGSGLFWGMEMIHPENGNQNKVAAHQLKNYLRDHHILVSTDGPFDNVLKSKPPLCFNMNNADQLLDGIRNWLKTTE